MKTKHQSELLRRIESGESLFNPVNDTEDAMREFQPLALELIELKKQGLIEMGNPVIENMSGHHFIILVSNCHLTYKGMQSLD